MTNEIKYQDIVEEEYALIDVRAPLEYEKGHIVEAYNVPLFTNEERAEIGTLYKKIGKDQAVKKGLEFVGPKMTVFIERVKEISEGRPVYVYCWRGGMRSESFTWLLNTAGIPAKKIIGGYKGIKSEMRKVFDQDILLRVIGGLTGSGKTDYLKHMEDIGYQVLDLEGLANHKGSAFGHINELDQPSTEQFENNIFSEWREFDFSRPILVEDESSKVGDAHVPPIIFSKMKEAPLIVINVPNSKRIERLIRDYTDTDKDIIIKACDSIQRKLGGQNHKEIVEAVLSDNLEKACDMLLVYYDKLYNHGLTHKKNTKIVDILLDKDDDKDNIRLLKETIDSI